MPQFLIEATRTIQISLEAEDYEVAVEHIRNELDLDWNRGDLDLRLLITDGIVNPAVHPPLAQGDPDIEAELADFMLKRIERASSH